MRTSIWVISISIGLNIVLAAILLDKINQKPILATAIQATKYSVSDAFVKSDVNVVKQVDEPLRVVSNTDMDPLVATINNVEVRQLELLPYLNEVIPADQINQFNSFGAIPEKYLKLAVDDYAVDLLIENLADKKGITNNKRLQTVLNKNKRRSIRTAYLGSISSTLVSEQQVKNKYDELTKSLKSKTEYHVRHILLASKKEADLISKALQKKERGFDDLAKLFSLDDATGFKGGDLGYQVIGQLNPVFEQAVSTLALNTYSQPFKTNLGWHIAIVEDRRKAQLMSYEQAASLIRNKLQQQAIKTFAEHLVADAKIVFTKQATVNAE